MARLFPLGAGILFFCYAISPALSLEVAPRLTDREIIESLAELKQGQRDINARFEGVDKRFDDLRFDMNKQFDHVNGRIDDLRLDMDKKFDHVNGRIDDLRLDMNNKFDHVNGRIDDLRLDMNKRFEGIDKRIDDLRFDINKRMDSNHQTMLAMFGTLVTLIVALFGYIAWDRRTLVRPLQEKLNLLEHVQTREIQTLQEQSSRLENLLNVLRELAHKDEKLASVLRSFSFL